MAHYLEIHSVPKARIHGVKVLSFVDVDFKDEMNPHFETERTFMNDTVRQYFGADHEDDWDADYFVLREDDALYLIKDIEALYKEPDVDQEEVELIARLTSVLEFIQSDFGNSTHGYVISWSK